MNPGQKLLVPDGAQTAYFMGKSPCRKRLIPSLYQKTAQFLSASEEIPEAESSAITSSSAISYPQESELTSTASSSKSIPSVAQPGAITVRNLNVRQNERSHRLERFHTL